ncbi:uncharacterized protein LOC135217515 [Macrobrachium nipponense]|uniref:uncharacterized protein LOC135217515 n=1 Tax=Macrobrachium nipponense TaxID=159736 RepID=UPI0030C81B53
MKVQILIVAVALGLCTGLSIQREQRKFIYQDGHPSVRRYPVFPDRHSSLEQTLPSALDDDIRNELEEESAVSPSTDEPLVPELEGDAPEVPEDEAPSTDISPALESESTSTAPVTTPETPFFDSTVPLHLEGFSFTPKPFSVLEESPSFLFSPENIPRDIIPSNDPAAEDGPSFVGNAPIANDGPAFFGNAPVTSDGPSFVGNAPIANDGPAFFGSAPVANDGSAFFGNAPVANDESFLFGNPPVSNDGSFFIGNAPVANDGSSFVGDAPVANEESASFAFGGPDSVFGRDDAGHREVFTADDARPVDPSLFPSSPAFGVPALPPSFGVFTETAEESTDIPVTTDVVNNFLTGEEEVANSTIAPSEEGSERLSENVTEVPVFDQTVTEAEWASVTQDFVPTEETEAF